jgi:hypothetical protein
MHTEGQEQKHTRRALNKTHFNRGANVRFHFACASMCTHLLPKRVKDVETFRC